MGLQVCSPLAERLALRRWAIRAFAFSAWALLTTFLAPASWADPLVLTQSWSVPIDGPSDCAPAIADDGTIYFGTSLGTLWAVTSKGAKKWTFRAEREIKSSPAIGDDGTIYFGSRDRKFYAVDPYGRRKWDFKTGAWVDSSPAIGAKGDLYFGSWDKQFYALKPDGTKEWEFPTGGPIVSSPAVSAEGLIYFGSHDGKFYALKPDGTKAWDYTTGAPIISSPAIDKDGTIYITSVNGWFYALNPGGTLKWRLRTGGITESSPVIGQDGTLYVGVNNNVKIISANGRTLGEQLGDKLVFSSPTALADGSVCFISGFGTLVDFTAPGVWKWVRSGLGLRSESIAVSENGDVLVSGFLDNRPSFLSLHATVRTAESSWPKFHRSRGNTGAACEKLH